MAARSLETDSAGFPLRTGMLGLSGALLQGARRTDGCGAVIDEAGSVCVFVVRVSAESPRAGLPALAAAAVTAAARSRLPVYELVADVRRFVASEPGASVGLSLLRFSPRDARVEILNAGMPSIVRLLPGAPPTLFASRSAAIGDRFPEVHPYELSPLVWGSAWLLTSDGVTGGSLDPAALLRGIAGSGLEQSAYELADADSARVAAVAEALSAATGEPAGDSDRTLLIISADPRRRFESGIETRG